MKIPKKVYITAKDAIPVVQLENIEGNNLGYYDPKEGRIAIQKDIPEIGKWIIVIHEVLHALDGQNVAHGVYKKGLTETQVTELAFGLFCSLSLSGGVPKITLSQLRKFIKDGNDQ